MNLTIGNNFRMDEKLQRLCLVNLTKLTKKEIKKWRRPKNRLIIRKREIKAVTSLRVGILLEKIQFKINCKTHKKLKKLFGGEFIDELTSKSHCDGLCCKPIHRLSQSPTPVLSEDNNNSKIDFDLNDPTMVDLLFPSRPNCLPRFQCISIPADTVLLYDEQSVREKTICIADDCSYKTKDPLCAKEKTICIADKCFDKTKDSHCAKEKTIYNADECLDKSKDPLHVNEKTISFVDECLDKTRDPLCAKEKTICIADECSNKTNDLPVVTVIKTEESDDEDVVFVREDSINPQSVASTVTSPVIRVRSPNFLGLDSGSQGNALQKDCSKEANTIDISKHKSSQPLYVVLRVDLPQTSQDDTTVKVVQSTFSEPVYEQNRLQSPNQSISEQSSLINPVQSNSSFAIPISSHAPLARNVQSSMVESRTAMSQPENYTNHPSQQPQRQLQFNLLNSNPNNVLQQSQTFQLQPLFQLSNPSQTQTISQPFNPSQRLPIAQPFNPTQTQTTPQPFNPSQRLPIAQPFNPTQTQTTPQPFYPSQKQSVSQPFNPSQTQTTPQPFNPTQTQPASQLSNPSKTQTISQPFDPSQRQPKPQTFNLIQTQLASLLSNPSQTQSVSGPFDPLQTQPTTRPFNPSQTQPASQLSNPSQTQTISQTFNPSQRQPRQRQTFNPTQTQSVSQQFNPLQTQCTPRPFNLIQTQLASLLSNLSQTQPIPQSFNPSQSQSLSPTLDPSQTQPTPQPFNPSQTQPTPQPFNPSQSQPISPILDPSQTQAFSVRNNQQQNQTRSTNMDSLHYNQQPSHQTNFLPRTYQPARPAVSSSAFSNYQLSTEQHSNSPAINQQQNQLPDNMNPLYFNQQHSMKRTTSQLANQTNRLLAASGSSTYQDHIRLLQDQIIGLSQQSCNPEDPVDQLLLEMIQAQKQLPDLSQDPTFMDILNLQPFTNQSETVKPANFPAAFFDGQLDLR